MAVIPTLAILPKETGDGVVLAGPMFDHAKAAIIDDIARLGLPPDNPFFGAAGDRLAYYYLWYFGAAQFARVLGISGWEADVAITWFTAFASLTLMMGLAAWLSRRAFATLWVGLFALAASLRFQPSSQCRPSRDTTDGSTAVMSSARRQVVMVASTSSGRPRSTLQCGAERE